MSVATSPQRKIKQSLEIFLEQRLSGAGWTRIPVIDEFPEEPRIPPWIAVEESLIERYPIELGNACEGNRYYYDLHMSCENKGQRSDLLHTLIGDDETTGALSKELPVYEIAGTTTGAYLWPCRMEIDRVDRMTLSAHPQDKFRALVTLAVQRR